MKLVQLISEIFYEEDIGTTDLTKRDKMATRQNYHLFGGHLKYNKRNTLLLFSDYNKRILYRNLLVRTGKFKTIDLGVFLWQ